MFRYWNTKTDSWEVEGGTYELRVGASSADIRLTAAVEVNGTSAPNPYAGKALPHYTSGKVQHVPMPSGRFCWAAPSRRIPSKLTAT